MNKYKNFTLWASYKGEGVYTDKEQTFSVLENSVKQANEVVLRKYPINKIKGENFTLLKNCIIKTINGEHTLKGNHELYTNIITKIKL